MDILSIIGIILAVGIAIWQSVKTKSTQKELDKNLLKIPNDLLNHMDMVVTTSSNVKILQPDEQPIPHAFITYADVNNDTKPEMLVQYPTGNHGTALKILGFKDFEFIILAELGCGTPEGFSFGDFDGDGKIEIAARETDWSSGMSYVEAPRMTIIYKWDGNNFVKISEKKDRLNIAINNIENQEND